jgi:hypothetical protein
MFSLCLNRTRHDYDHAASAVDNSSATQLVRLGAKIKLASAAAAEPLAMCGMGV